MFMDLLVMFSVVVLIWIALFRWKRRRFYKLAAEFVGPPIVPLFGNALTYIKPKHDNIMKRSYGRAFDFQSPIKLWIAHKLLFSVYDPVNLETILNSPHALEKHAMYKFANAAGIGIFNANVPMWRAHKKLIAPTFNQKVLDGFVATFSKQANILVDKLEEHAGKGIFDVFEPVIITTVNSLSETALGYEKGFDSETDIVHWIETFMSVLCKRITYNLLYYYDFTFKMTAQGKEFFDIVKVGRKIIQNIIDSKKEDYEREKKENYVVSVEEETSKRNAFLPKLIELADKGKGLTDTELLDEVGVLIIAGSDTSATMISYILMMLGMHPEIQEKVYKEVIDTVGFDRPIEHTDLQNLSYTELVIKETLRILPVGPLIARAVTGDIELKDGRVIPEGASVLISIILAHRNPEYWPDPLKFDPLRFLPEECAKRHRYCFLPFVAGPRKCIETSKRNAFLPKLIDLADKGKGLTDTELVDEVGVLVIAGSDTSATMISYILMMLGMHPEIQEKVYKEVIDTVGFDRPIEHTDLQNLSYTELVIKETLRILPVGPMIIRAVTGDIVLKDGRMIPEGASVIISIILAHRNPKYWPDPLKFDPLRFLPKECAKRHPYCFLPFVAGPRKCIGIQYAMMSMKVTVATVVRKYLLKTCYKTPKDVKLTQHIASKPVNGFLISLEKRSSQ